MKLTIFLIIPFVASLKLFSKNNFNRNFMKLNNYINYDLLSSYNYDSIIDNDLLLLKTIVSISAIECLSFNYFMNMIYPEFIKYYY